MCASVRASVCVCQCTLCTRSVGHLQLDDALVRIERAGVDHRDQLVRVSEHGPVADPEVIGAILLERSP